MFHCYANFPVKTHVRRQEFTVHKIGPHNFRPFASMPYTFGIIRNMIFGDIWSTSIISRRKLVANSETPSRRHPYLQKFPEHYHQKMPETSAETAIACHVQRHLKDLTANVGYLSLEPSDGDGHQIWVVQHLHYLLSTALTSPSPTLHSPVFSSQRRAWSEFPTISAFKAFSAE